jgi:hypothetical protein
MWQLSMRGKDRRLTDLGMFDDIIAATKILSRLEYQGREGFYTLIRRVQ